MSNTKVVTLEVRTGSSQKDVESLGKGLQKVDKSVDKISTKSSKAGKGLIGMFTGVKTAVLNAVPALRTFTAALFSTGIGALVVALGAFIGLMSKALNKSKDFSKALSALKAVSGSTEQEMQALNQQAKELGSTTAFTATQVVELQTELAKLGFAASDIKNSTPSILDLAASLEVDLASAAEFTGSVVRSFGLTTQETQRVVDVMAESTSSSALNFSALTESMKIAAPTSKALGISVEKTTALLGVLADTGLKGSIAGTGLSKTFIALNKEGISLEQAMIKVKTSSNQLNTAVELVGIVGAKSLLNLANAGDKIGDLEEKFNNAAGAAKRIADLRLDNLTGDLTKLSSAWEGFLLNLEDGSGLLNKISRGGVTLLTNGLSGLVTLTNGLSDAWVIGTTIITEKFNVARNILGSGFDLLGSKIKSFGLSVLLSLSEVPLLGKAIDGEKIKENLATVEKELVDSSLRLQTALDSNFNTTIRAAEINAKLDADRIISLAKATADAVDDIIEIADEEIDSGVDKAAQRVIEFKKKLKKTVDDYNAKTELEKIELDRARHLAELNQLELDTIEKEELKKQINDLYNSKVKEEKASLEEQALKQEEFTAQRKKQLINEGLDAIVSAAGQESAIGKAVFIAKQAMLVKEQIADARATLSKITLRASAAGVDVASGAAKSASALPFPANIPLIIGFAVQAAGIFSSIKSAVNAAKGSASKMGASGGGSSVSSPRISASAASLPPAFNVVGASETNQLAQSIGQDEKQPIKAFVVSNDVSDAQSLDRNIIESASIG
tara:strand:- start:1122 stop:3482 length:2361 start_codon:yes stop_codon:yes gene_type:complete